ncbi:MAG: DUF262 domain-containing protein [Bacteroidetes bacterium]|nr:MAG: DUF262 domain-containing protein [Bacteroidota bacterium]
MNEIQEKQKAEAFLEKITQEINDQRNILKTERLDMSFGELMTMYKEGELKINPAFQRHFKWNNEQQTRFIESLILGIPIPPIFVTETPYGDDNSVWEVLDADGLQRLSTILSFFGDLKSNDEKIKKKNNWVLQKGDRLSSIEGLKWIDLPQKIRFNIKKYACRVEIIKWSGNYDMRFELFNRLNTGGTKLTPQEIRNAIYRDISPKFNDFLLKLAQNIEFQNLVALSEKEKSELYDQELILRFLSLFKIGKKLNQSISQHMSTFMREALENEKFDYENYEKIFNETIKILFPLGKEIFRQENSVFATSLYDTIMLGVSENIHLYQNENSVNIIKDKINNQIRQDKILIKFSRRGGNNQFERVRNRIKIANEIFGKI